MPRKNTGTQKIASSSMDATTQHPDYVVRIPEWQRVRDCMKGEQAIKNAESKNDIVTWVHAVVDGLSPTIKGYSNRQINLALALLVYEQWQRDAAYSDLFCRFAEKYEADGRVY